MATTIVSDVIVLALVKMSTGEGRVWPFSYVGPASLLRPSKSLIMVLFPEPVDPMNTIFGSRWVRGT